MKRYLNKLMQELSLLGKAMLVPITVMPVAGIIGLIFGADFLNIPVIAGLSSIVFGNVDFLFVLGAAGAYSKAKDKTTVMVGAVVAFLVFKQTLGTLNPDVNAGVFGGILVGIAVAYTYNHTHKLKAPADICMAVFRHLDLSPERHGRVRRMVRWYGSCRRIPVHFPEPGADSSGTSSGIKRLHSV